MVDVVSAEQSRRRGYREPLPGQEPGEDKKAQEIQEKSRNLQHTFT